MELGTIKFRNYNEITKKIIFIIRLNGELEIKTELKLNIKDSIMAAYITRTVVSSLKFK